MPQIFSNTNKLFTNERMGLSIFGGLQQQQYQYYQYYNYYIFIQSLIPEEQNNITTQRCSTGQPYTANTQILYKKPVPGTDFNDAHDARQETILCIWGFQQGWFVIIQDTAKYCKIIHSYTHKYVPFTPQWSSFSVTANVHNHIMLTSTCLEGFISHFRSQ